MKNVEHVIDITKPGLYSDVYMHALLSNLYANICVENDKQLCENVKLHKLLIEHALNWSI